MKDLENVLKNKDLLLKVEHLVCGLTIDTSQEVFNELNRLTGNDWSREQYENQIFDYPDFKDLEEVVYALFHNGDYPNRKSEDCEAWNIEESVDDDKNACSFFIRLKYKKDWEKCSRYEEIDVNRLYQDLLVAFPTWKEDADSWGKFFLCKNKEVYGFEKAFFIRNVYDQKFLSCTLTNMTEEEKDTFVRILGKYCNHVRTRATYKLKFMFDWGSGICVWSDNDAARTKFNDYPIETDKLPISNGLKETLDDLINLYDTCLNREDPNGDLMWNKNQIEEFLKMARNAYVKLCKELGSKYEIELILDDFDTDL
ncbi:MAG: hypothetical protein J5965_14135 [Aeriscardovia sp.]|nr:hypothetical protein [Aeriscardovia sp.]MBP3717864.1 hypothetical protein [Paludibacteraceae bacterium]